MKTKYAIRIVKQVLESLTNDDRITETKANIMERLFSDLLYGFMIDVNYLLEHYEEWFEIKK